VRLGATRPIKIDVRFVAATNRDLPTEIAARRFRQDLYYRLDGIALVIPPLRERRARIVPLAMRFLAEACAQLGRPPLALSLPLAAALEAQPWPGNVRELRAVLERAVLLARGGELGVRHLAIAPIAVAPAAVSPAAAVAPAVADDPAAAFLAALSPAERDERQRVVDALARCGGNQRRAAQLLGVSRSTLVNRIKQYRIARPHA
jgi:two-component system response regulator AtoC